MACYGDPAQRSLRASGGGKEADGGGGVQHGPAVGLQSVKSNTQVLINCRNGKKLLGRVKAFDRRNMVLENVKEMWTEVLKTGKGKRKANR